MPAKPLVNTAKKHSNVSDVRGFMAKHGLAAFLVPSADEYQGEYTPESAKRLAWLSGFTGSAGMAVVMSSGNNGFFTDGRYTLQARDELDEKAWSVINHADTSVTQWLKASLKKGDIVGFDPWLHTQQWTKQTQDALSTAGIILRATETNPVDAAWRSRPQAPCAEAVLHPEKYAGEPREKKIARTRDIMAQNVADALLISLPESLCWLLNIRGNDVPYTPFVLSYALLHADKKIEWFVDAHKVTPEVKRALHAHVQVKPISALPESFALLAKQKKRLWIDAATSAHWFTQEAAKHQLATYCAQDPILLMKACKNTVEIRGTKAAHQRDGLAVCRFLYWLSKEFPKAEVTEISVAEKLAAIRAQHPMFRDLSFDTIAGSGANGAIVHYRASEKSNRRLSVKDTILLLDSGAQYPDGTTDITRTIALSTPTQEHKDRFTRVLKGHIALASATFPKGTSGSQLDVLARQFLWEAGLDYDHGTGHGVGAYLSVHEGPQRISKRGGDTPLAAGMILSNEPGYYRAGAYGIRIENLVLVVNKKSAKTSPMLGFETLTLAPIDTRLVDKKLLTHNERVWLNSYHARVLKAHSPLLSPAHRSWLKIACKPI